MIFSDRFATMRRDISTHGGYRTTALTCSLPLRLTLMLFFSKTPEFIGKYMGEEARYRYKTTLFLQPLTEIHLRSHLNGEIEANGDIIHIYLFSAIGLFILLIACFNYVNLATALYTRRNREVGIRKVVGASRRHIRRQFLGEALYLSLAALLVALALVVMLLPSINSLVGKDLHVKGNSCFLLRALTLMLGVGIGAGSYPALYLSANAPSRIIGEDTTGSIKGTTLRKMLIVAQFTISTIFIIGTFVIYAQLHYIQTKKFGFDKEHLLNYTHG